MIDVKKLVTGFLVLAVAVGASAFLISAFASGSASANDTNPTVVATAAGQSGTALTGSAFLPQSASDNIDDDSTDPPVDPALASSTDPNNLTNLLSEAYLTDLMSVNPQGPTTDDNGNTSLTPPDSSDVIAQLENYAATSTAVQVPDWDAEAAQIPIIVMQTSSPNAVTNYSSAVQSILNEDFEATNVDAMLANNSDPSAEAYVEPKIQGALEDIAGLQTPASLVNFQKSLITFLVYGKNTLDLTENVSSSSDPLKAALVLQTETQKYDAVAQNLNTQLQQVSALEGFSPPFATNTTQPSATNPTSIVADINNILGIKTADAQVIVFDPSAFEQLITNYAKDVALQILKNLIVYTMQKTVLTWIQNSGAPRFITNWGTTLVNAYTNAAVNAVNSQFACVNPAYKAQLQVLLKLPTPNTAGGVCASQFSSALAGSNLTSFYNNFQSGGFVSYVTIFQPGGNIFGSAIDAQDVSLNAGLQSYAAAQTKSIANQGWNGQEVCGNGIDPNTGCKLGDLLNGTGKCITTSNQTYTPQGGGGQCSDGSSPTTLQPGQVTGQVFSSALNSGSNLATGANAVSGLLDAFTTSLLNSIATNLINLSTGALQNIGSTGNGTSGSGQSGNVPISCTPTFQTAGNPYAVTFLGAGGQTISVNSGTVITSSPSYSWTIQDALGNVVANGASGQFTTTFNASGTYTAIITDITPGDGNITAQCNVTVPEASGM